MPFHLGASSGESDVMFDLSRGRVQRTTIVMPVTMSLAAGPEPKTLELRIATTMTLEVIEPAAR